MGHEGASSWLSPYPWLGVGLYAALYRTSGAFYDLARPDALAALLTGLVVVIGRDAGEHAHPVRATLSASLLMSLAFLTKQTASVFYPAVGLFWLWRAPKWGLLYLTATLTLTSSACYALNVSTEGAFWRYIFEGHQGHVFYWKNILLRYWRDVLFLAPLLLLVPLAWYALWSRVKLLPALLMAWWLAAIAQRLTTLTYPPHMYYRELWYEEALPHRLALIIPLLLVALGAWGLWRAWRSCAPHATPLTSHTHHLTQDAHPRLKMSGYWLWIFIAGAGASALNHSTQWAYANCFMPLGFACALSLPLMLKDLLEGSQVSHPDTHKITHKITHRGSSHHAFILLALLGVQWGAWVYSPNAQVPQEADRSALSALEHKLTTREPQGALFAPASPLTPYLLTLGPVHTHQMGIHDVAYRGGVRGAEALFKRAISRDSTQWRWAQVLTHEHATLPWLPRGYFQAERLTFHAPNALRAKTGFLTRPQALWYPRYAEGARSLKGAQGELSANFEPPHALMVSSQASHQALTWAQLGWRAEGDAFQRGPTSLKARHIEGREGDYAALSQKQGKGALSATLSPPEGSINHLSLTLLSQGVESPSRTQQRRRLRRAHPIRGLTVSLYARSGERVASAYLKSGAPQRLHLPLKTTQHIKALWPLTVRFRDERDNAGGWIDDLRWQRPLGEP